MSRHGRADWGLAWLLKWWYSESAELRVAPQSAPVAQWIEPQTSNLCGRGFESLQAH